jgi:SPP1 family predicted phage head-tail adaptor
VVAPAIGIGDLRQRGTLQRRVETSDGQGGVDVTWSLIGSAWMAVDMDGGSGGEKLGAGSMVTAQALVPVFMRYRADLSVKDRIVLGDRTLDIATMTDVGGRRRWWQLMCAEVQG